MTATRQLSQQLHHARWLGAYPFHLDPTLSLGRSRSNRGVLHHRCHLLRVAIALGGGFEVVLACDLVVAADHVRFGLPEPRRGIYAGGGGVHRLPRQIPLKLAMEYLLTSREMTAHEAKDLGLVNEVVPYVELDAAVDRLIDDVMLGAPLSIRATKQAAMQGLDRPLSEAFAADYPAVRAMRDSEDSREGPKAFAEKRPPNWTGR